MKKQTPTATGFDFEPLPDGKVLIEFCGDEGKTFNWQVVTPSVIREHDARGSPDRRGVEEGAGSGQGDHGEVEP